MALLLIIVGTVVVLAGLGMLRMGGPKGLDVSTLLDGVMKNNKGYPSSHVSVTDAYGQNFSVSTPLEPMKVERYDGMEADALSELMRERGEGGHGSGPGPNHPG